jgi:hypothetical protein
MIAVNARDARKTAALGSRRPIGSGFFLIVFLMSFVGFRIRRTGTSIRLRVRCRKSES